MKIFVPASCGSDSTYLLYKVLTEYDGEVIARIMRTDTTYEDMMTLSKVHSWLKNNVRNFDFSFAEFEREVYPGGGVLPNMASNFGRMAKHHDCDLIALGYNAFNWSHSNWYWQTNDPIEKFYEKGMPYGNFEPQRDHSPLRDYWDGPIEWPVMSRSSEPIGRFQVWENLPNELKSIVYICSCGKCNKCLSGKFYRKMKAEGHTAQKIDDEIQRLGRYGKYYCSETISSESNIAYRHL